MNSSTTKQDSGLAKESRAIHLRLQWTRLYSYVRFHTDINNKGNVLISNRANASLTRASPLTTMNMILFIHKLDRTSALAF